MPACRRRNRRCSRGRRFRPWPHGTAASRWARSPVAFFSIGLSLSWTTLRVATIPLAQRWPHPLTLSPTNKYDGARNSRIVTSNHDPRVELLVPITLPRIRRSSDTAQFSDLRHPEVCSTSTSPARTAPRGLFPLIIASAVERRATGSPGTSSRRLEFQMTAVHHRVLEPPGRSRVELRRAPAAEVAAESAGLHSSPSSSTWKVVRAGDRRFLLRRCRHTSIIGVCNAFDPTTTHPTANLAKPDILVVRLTTRPGSSAANFTAESLYLEGGDRRMVSAEPVPTHQPALQEARIPVWTAMGCSPSTSSGVRARGRVEPVAEPGQ